MILRKLNILKDNSFFLFGARGTGKATSLSQLFAANEYHLVDLLQPQLFAELQANPQHFQRLIQPAIDQKKWILVDEIQKIPALLDLVHFNIEKNNALFGLTGSSARKLRRGAANLLAGRAFTHNLYPLLASELGEQFELETALAWGTLPKNYFLRSNSSRSAFLQAYTESYLQEEVIAEQIVRNLPPFRRFLQIAAQANATIVNYAKIAADALTDPSNVKNYFQILEDTLVGSFLEPYHHSIRKRQRQAPKFYLFDCGIVRALAKLLDVPLREGTYEFGKLFESFIYNQILAELSYQKKQFTLSYLRTKDDAEIDLIVERAGQPTLLIEIKSAQIVRDEDIGQFKQLSRDFQNAIPICLYRGEATLKSDGVVIIPWQKGLVEYGIS